MVIRSASMGLVLVLAIAIGCNKTEEPTPAQTPAPRATLGVGAKKAEGPVDIGYDAPASWQKVESPSKMRKATFKIPRAAGDSEDAELSVMSAGGSVDMNIERWAGQFGKKGADVTRTARKVGDLAVTLVEVKGVYAGSGMPGADPGPPKEGWALLGAIVVGPGASPGPSGTTFFKMTGPEKTVAAAKPDFDKFVGSMRLR